MTGKRNLSSWRRMYAGITRTCTQYRWPCAECPACCELKVTYVGLKSYLFLKFFLNSGQQKILILSMQGTELSGHPAPPLAVSLPVSSTGSEVPQREEESSCSGTEPGVVPGPEQARHQWVCSVEQAKMVIFTPKLLLNLKLLVFLRLDDYKCPLYLSWADLLWLTTSGSHKMFILLCSK